jgi:hypothetical protein
MDGNSTERLSPLDGNASEAVLQDTESLSTVVGKVKRRTGRPAKVVDLKAVCARLARRESLRSVARHLGMSHSTLREHLQRSGLIGGFDY